MLDPQLQGITWVKEREAKRGLVCVRMGAPEMLRVMEKAISEVRCNVKRHPTVLCCAVRRGCALAANSATLS